MELWVIIGTRFALYLISLIRVVAGAFGLWGSSGAMLAGGAHLLIGLKFGKDP